MTAHSALDLAERCAAADDPPRPWHVAEIKAETPSRETYTLYELRDADNRHVMGTQLMPTRYMLDFICRAVNTVSWLSPDTLRQLDAARERVEAAVAG